MSESGFGLPPAKTLGGRILRLWALQLFFAWTTIIRVLRNNYALLFFFSICDIADFWGRRPPAIQGQHSLVSAAIQGQHPLLPPAIRVYNWVEIGHFGAQP